MEEEEIKTETEPTSNSSFPGILLMASIMQVDEKALTMMIIIKVTVGLFCLVALIGLKGGRKGGREGCNSINNNNIIIFTRDGRLHDLLSLRYIARLLVNGRNLNHRRSLEEKKEIN